MAWPKSGGPGRPRTLAPEERLRSEQQKNVVYYLRHVPDGACPDVRAIAAATCKVTLHNEVLDWAAPQLQAYDREHVRAVLGGALLQDFQIRNTERALDVLQREGLVVPSGDGWELKERIDAREHARTEQERKRQAEHDVYIARSWLQGNWELLTQQCGPTPTPEDFDAFIAKRQEDLLLAQRGEDTINELDPYALKRGLQIFHGEPNTVLLCQTDGIADVMTADESVLYDEQLALCKPRATLATEPKPKSKPEPEPASINRLTEAERIALRAKRAAEVAERSARLEREEAERMATYRAEHPQPAQDIVQPTRTQYMEDLLDEQEALDRSVTSSKAGLAKAKREVTKLKKLKCSDEALTAARAEVMDAEECLRLNVNDAAKQRTKIKATEAGMDAADAARAAGQSEAEAQAAGAAAYQAVMDGAEAGA